MSKTINFPEFMANEIINEDDIYPKIAFRLNEAYLNYYKKMDFVDIRVGERILRKGIILKDVYSMQLGELTFDILQFAKSQMKNIENIKDLLNKIYNTQINLNTNIYIVTYKNVRGRKAALNTLINLVCDNIIKPEEQIIGIAHADAYEDSLYIMDKIKEKINVRDFINTSYDFCTGSHVGPDTIALFFIGKDRELPQS